MVLKLEQEDVIILAVDVDQERADFLEFFSGDEDTVEIGLSTSLLSDVSLDEDFALLIKREVSRTVLLLPQAEDRLYCGFCFSCPYQVGRGFFSQGQPDSVDYDRFAGAGLSGENGEPFLKMDFQVLDGGQVLDVE
jgi:hypothetical protein